MNHVTRVDWQFQDETRRLVRVTLDAVSAARWDDAAALCETLGRVVDDHADTTRLGLWGVLRGLRPFGNLPLKVDRRGDRGATAEAEAASHWFPDAWIKQSNSHQYLLQVRRTPWNTKRGGFYSPSAHNMRDVPEHLAVRSFSAPDRILDPPVRDADRTASEWKALVGTVQQMSADGSGIRTLLKGVKETRSGVKLRAQGATSRMVVRREDTRITPNDAFRVPTGLFKYHLRGCDETAMTLRGDLHWWMDALLSPPWDLDYDPTTGVCSTVSDEPPMLLYPVSHLDTEIVGMMRVGRWLHVQIHEMVHRMDATSDVIPHVAKAYWKQRMTYDRFPYSYMGTKDGTEVLSVAIEKLATRPEAMDDRSRRFALGVLAAL